MALSPRADAPVWTPAADAAHAARLKAETEARVQALQAVLPGLAAQALTRADLELLGDDAEEPLAEVLQRAERHVVLKGRWAGGDLTLRVHDALLVIELQAADAAAARAALPGLLQGLADATGWSAWGFAPEQEMTAGQVADIAWQRLANVQAAMARGSRGRRRLQAAGPAAAVVLTVAAWGLALLLAAEGVQQHRLAQSVQPARAATFTAQQLEGPLPGLNLLQRYRLAGLVEPGGTETRLVVSRSLYLRAAPGARYGVVGTTDQARPYLLETEAAALQGPGGGWGLVLVGLVPLGLWSAGVAWPLLRGPRPAVWAVVSNRALFTGTALAVAAAAWWLRVR